jgi:hypothetical protein
LGRGKPAPNVTFDAARIDEVVAQALQSGEADLTLGLFGASKPALPADFVYTPSPLPRRSSWVDGFARWSSRVSLPLRIVLFRGLLGV